MGVRSRTSGTTRSLRAAGGTLAVLAAVMIAAPSAGAAPPPGKGKDPDKDQSPQAAICGGGGSDDNITGCNSSFKGAIDIPKSVVEALAGAAAKGAAGFAFKEAGFGDLVDPDNAKFRELNARLDAISKQIGVLQLSVNQVESELKKLALENSVQSILVPVTQIDSLYSDYFKPAANALTAYVEQERAVMAMDPPQQCDQVESCTTARSLWQTKRAAFLNAQAPVSATALNGALHGAIVGLAGAASLPRLYGEYLMAGPGSDGFLHDTDSKKLLAFESYFAEKEALATYMKAEWKSATSSAEDVKEFLDTEVTLWQKQESDIMPKASIPPGTVIALPVNAGDRKTTVGLPMFSWYANSAQRIGLPTRWDPSTPGAPGDVSTVLTAFNTTAAGRGLTGWHVPSRAEWDKILAGRFVNYPTDARGLLSRVFPFPGDPVSGVSLLNALDSTKLLWTSEPASEKACGWADVIGGTGFNEYGRLNDYAHTAMPTTPTLRTYPTGYTPANVPNIGGTLTVEVRGGLTKAAGMQACRDVLAAKVTAGFNAGAAATLIPVRTTAEKYMP